MPQKEIVNLMIDVPVCSLRKGAAREYLETEEMPPPSTIYGFLLSLIGAENRNTYIGSVIACARLGRPEISVVLRTYDVHVSNDSIKKHSRTSVFIVEPGKTRVSCKSPSKANLRENPEEKCTFSVRTCWRIKDAKVPPGIGHNKRPDFQEVLTGLRLAVWIKSGALADKLRVIHDHPSANRRYGGLSFGESRDLVNEVVWFPDYGNNLGEWLLCNEKGHLPLPVWVDHVGSKNTIWQQFTIIKATLCCPSEEDRRWITITDS